MKIVIEDKELIKESKEYLKSLLKKSAHFYTIASDEDMDSIIEGTIEECWFFTGKVTIEEDFNNLKNKVSSRLPRKQNGELYDVYKLWSEIDYKFIISEAILAISTIKSKKLDSNGKDEYQRDSVSRLIR